MPDLIIKNLDINEFNRWMLKLQKATEDLNYFFNRIKERGYGEQSLNDWLKDPETMCKEVLSQEDAHLKLKLYRAQELLASYAFSPEELFSERNGKIFISSYAEHIFFMYNGNYFDSGEEVLSILYDICHSLRELKRYGIDPHVLQDLIVKGTYDVNMEAFEEFVENNDI